jgi:hypothetical protein
MNTELGQTVVIACDLSAIPADEREAHEATAGQLFSTVQAVLELEDGYALWLPSTSDNLLKAARFIANERLCCPFFSFGLEVEASGGPLWLELKGSAGVKQFIEDALLSGPAFENIRLQKPDGQAH